MTHPLPAPAPVVNSETRGFWDATAEGRFVLSRCRECDLFIWYPRRICPACHSGATEWVDSAGRGIIYSFAITHKGMGEYARCGPYVLAYVTLDEGPRMMTNIVECEPAQLEIGLPVELVLHDTGAGNALPRFRPAQRS